MSYGYLAHGCELSSFLIKVQTIVRHVVKYFQTHHEAVLVPTDLSVEIEYASIKNLNSARFQELPMILSHQLFAFLCKLWGNLYENVLTVSIEVEIVVFEEVKHGVREGARPWTHLHHS